MSKLMQRLGYKAHRLTTISRRSLSDRSHRLAGLPALAGAQEFKKVFTYDPFEQAQLHPRDMSKQLVLDLRPFNEYKTGHIAKAVCLDREKLDFFNHVDFQGGITFDAVYNAMRSVGASDDTSEIILYDNDGSQSACRLWFVLRYFGFTNVRVLNGGYSLWESAGIPAETKDNTPSKPSSSLSLKPIRHKIVTRPSQMVENHQAKRSKYLDARSSADFNAGLASHIERAVNVPSDSFFVDGKFKTVKEIRNITMAQGFDVMNSSNHIIVYSSTNRAASATFFAMNMVGFERLSLYDQGYENWVLNKDKTLNIDQQDAFSK